MARLLPFKMALFYYHVFIIIFFFALTTDETQLFSRTAKSLYPDKPFSITV